MKKFFILVTLASLSTLVNAQINPFYNPYAAYQQHMQNVIEQQNRQLVEGFREHMKNFNWNQSVPVQQNNYYDSESNTSTQQQQPQSTQGYTKTCGVCHGTGKCRNCVNGWVKRISGQDGPCPVCPNHNGLCSSCGGRGSWKE